MKYANSDTPHEYRLEKKEIGHGIFQTRILGEFDTPSGKETGMFQDGYGNSQEEADADVKQKLNDMILNGEEAKRMLQLF